MKLVVAQVQGGIYGFKRLKVDGDFLFLAFLCGCRKYRSLQTQYYERVSLMKTQPENGGADRPSDI